ncbi:hypothetical protein B0H11DRAFT_111426 [Mycena galericulata]|nr:hypothetical protein B0H11DRAFT_337548 [Mycena galericulata]KAJ7461677.1 hypothetical protein B0H11DRAFT_111426 [Mycena galericulata]
MFPFSSFGVPIVFGAVLVVAMLVGVSCMWDLWSRRPPVSLASEVEERPQLWDLFIEDPVGLKPDDTKWENLLPFSVTKWATTELEHRTFPTKAGANRLTTMQRIHRTRKTGDDFDDAYYHDLRIAVAIAMPSARNPPRSSSSTDNHDEEHLTLCIGLHQAMVAGLPLDFST